MQPSLNTKLTTMSLKAVIFDFDGTLANLGSKVDWKAAKRKLVEAFNRLGVPAKTYRGRLNESAIFPGIVKIREEIRAQENAQSTKEIWSTILKILLKYEAEGAAKTSLLPYCKEAVETLQSYGLKVGIVSSNSEEVVCTILRNHSVIERVEMVVGRETCEEQKPDPEPFLRCAREMRVNPDETLVVGDSLQDLEGSRKAGMMFLGVLTGVSDESVLKAAGAQHIAHNLKDATAYIELRLRVV